ncbi:MULTISPECIES: CPBP family intramembrane glutamic endopeptidase [unclassified Paenibacillus]|uniref:CPBP family intramembrane glutamic endopeptidase n=1 Tax=unclassified Paenibacillus TaxID=185978 RepID=UPI0030FC6563
MNRTKWCAIGAVYILLTAILIIHPRQETLYLLIFTQTQLLINLNAYRIRDSAFKGANWVRRSVYFFSYLIAYSFFSSPSLEKGNLIISFSLALLAGLIFLIPRFGEIKPFYNKDLTLFFPPLSLNAACLEVYSYLCSAVLQELYYKAFVIALLMPLTGAVAAVIISALLFVFDHLVHARSSTFKLPDYLAQFVMGLCSGLLYVYSGSVWVAVLVHFTFNAPLAFSYLYRYGVTMRMNMKVD